MSNKRRRSSKKKHEVPLTEDMLNELNKASLGHQGYMMHGNNHHAMGYDNYGQDPDDFFDSDDVWNNDKYYHGQQRYKVSSLKIRCDYVATFTCYRPFLKSNHVCK